MRLRIPTSLALGAAAVVAAAGLAAPTSATPRPARRGRVAVPQQAADGSLTGTTTVLVHGATLADGDLGGHRHRHDEPRRRSQDRRRRRASAPRRRSRRCAASPACTYVEAGDQPIGFFAETSNKATRGLEATQTADRRRRHAAHRQGRLRRRHRLRRRPDPPVLQGGRRQQRRRRQLQDAVRPDRDPAARCRRCRTPSTPTPSRSAATAPT